jgi:predicted transcriptional regulator
MARTQQELRDRALAAAAQHKAGKTYREIGNLIGLSPAVVARICRSTEYKDGIADSDWRLALPSAVFNSLKGSGIACREDAIAAVMAGKKIPNLGKKGLELLRSALGLEPQPEANASASPVAIERAIALLERNGYSVTKKGEADF